MLPLNISWNKRDRSRSRWNATDVEETASDKLECKDVTGRKAGVKLTVPVLNAHTGDWGSACGGHHSTHLVTICVYLTTAFGDWLIDWLVNWLIDWLIEFELFIKFMWHFVWSFSFKVNATEKYYSATVWPKRTWSTSNKRVSGNELSWVILWSFGNIFKFRQIWSKENLGNLPNDDSLWSDNCCMRTRSRIYLYSCC